MIIINFKNYKIGKEVLDLTRTIDIYCNKATISVPSVNLQEIVKETTLPVYAQNVDFDHKGVGTGKIIPEALFALGVKGSILNHSENKISLAKIKKTIERCNNVGLKLVVCASNLDEVKRIKKLKPYAIAYEDPKLISTGKSITEHKSNEITKFVELLKDSKILPLCGAGISSGKDVAEALILGCKGVLVSSIVANSQNPENFLKEISGLF